MIKLDFAQGTPEWDAARLGIPTSSGFDKIVTMKGEPSKSAQKYMYQLAAERIVGYKEETYQNAAMQRGTAMEPEARNMYAFITDNEVEQVGFCYYDEKEDIGCSPDGLIVGKDGGLEIKCPTPAVHIEYLFKNKLPSAYFQQVQGQLFVTGLEWIDFFSYYPGLEPLLIRVERDKDFHEALEKELYAFNRELITVTKRLKEICNANGV